MKKPDIDWPSKDETDDILSTLDMTKSEVRDEIEESIREAERLAKLGLTYLTPIINDKRSTWENRFNRTDILARWFGCVTKANHVKDVHRRLDRICDRATDKVLTVKVRLDLPKDYQAQNLGSFLSPRTFKVAVDWFDATATVRGGVICHELDHEWHKDQKLKNGDVVYGREKALKLAKQNAGKARRSPENYQQFVLDADFQGKLALKEASGSVKRVG